MVVRFFDNLVDFVLNTVVVVEFQAGFAETLLRRRFTDFLFVLFFS